jgi:hypothetical protein
MVGNVGEAGGRASRGYVAGGSRDIRVPKEARHANAEEVRHTDAEGSAEYGCRRKRDIPMPKEARHTEGSATY